MRTYSPKAGDAVRKWHIIDAQDVVLGRLATHAAVLLRGKHKPTFAPHMDMGDFVIVINAEKIALSGNKSKQKWAHHHSGFPGGLTSTVYGELLEKHPTRAVEKAIKGMIPKNRLGTRYRFKAKGLCGSKSPTCSTSTNTICIRSSFTNREVRDDNVREHNSFRSR